MEAIDRMDTQEPVLQIPPIRVKYAKSCSLILIPTRQEYDEAGIELWYGRFCFEQAKLQASHEIKSFMQANPQMSFKEAIACLYQPSDSESATESSQNQFGVPELLGSPGLVANSTAIRKSSKLEKSTVESAPPSPFSNASGGGASAGTVGGKTSTSPSHCFPDALLLACSSLDESCTSSATTTDDGSVYMTDYESSSSTNSDFDRIGYKPDWANTRPNPRRMSPRTSSESSGTSDGSAGSDGSVGSDT